MTSKKKTEDGATCTCGACAWTGDTKCRCRLFLGVAAVVLLIVAFFVFDPFGRGEAPLTPMEIQTVYLERQDGKRFSVEVEVAETLQQQIHGLMNRTSLEEGKGMLFVYSEPQQVRFWMKDTLIPLDMLFIREDGIIVKIVQGAQPHDETPIPSEAPVTSVLEVKGGEVKRMGLQPGDSLETE